MDDNPMITKSELLELIRENGLKAVSMGGPIQTVGDIEMRVQPRRCYQISKLTDEIAYLARHGVKTIGVYTVTPGITFSDGGVTENDGVYIRWAYYAEVRTRRVVE